LNASHAILRKPHHESSTTNAAANGDSLTPYYWKSKSLGEMTLLEWEYLCDGCGKCCLYILQDTITGRSFYTRVACRLMDIASCRCRCYENRLERQSRCTILTPENIEELDCLPSTCAYKRVARGQSLDWWHPLVSGNPGTVHLAGASILGKAVSGQSIPTEQLVNYISRDDEWNR